MLVSWNVVPWKLTAGTLENSPLKRNIIWTKPSFFLENSSCEFSKGKKPSPFLQSMHLLGWRLDFYRFFGSNKFQVKLETGNLSFWRDIFCHNYSQGRTITRCRSPTFWGLERRGWFWDEFTVSFLKNIHMTYDILSYDLNAPTSYFSPAIFNFLGLTSFWSDSFERKPNHPSAFGWTTWK